MQDTSFDSLIYSPKTTYFYMHFVNKHFNIAVKIMHKFNVWPLFKLSLMTTEFTLFKSMVHFLSNYLLINNYNMRFLCFYMSYRCIQNPFISFICSIGIE